MKQYRSYNIGGCICFTIEKAIYLYKQLAKRCYNNLTLESSVALAGVADYMRNEIGLSYTEIEQLEIDAIKGE